MIRILAALLCAASLAAPLNAQGVRGQPADDIPGQFDYYVLSLSWAPSWCQSTDNHRDSVSCDRGRKAGFVVHGLWPQYERGWPDHCPTTRHGPSRAQTRAMEDLMGSSGLAWYQWRKHGTCSGLSAQGYFDATRKAADVISIPPVLSQLARDVSLPARVVEDAFIEENPLLTRNGITVTCQDRRLQEVRICLTRDLQPRDCAADTRRDCSHSMIMPAPQ